MANVHTESPTRELAKSLDGIDFPADKNRIAEYAQKKGASQELVERINQLPDEQYTSMADVFKGFGMSENK